MEGWKRALWSLPLVLAAVLGARNAEAQDATSASAQASPRKTDYKCPKCERLDAFRLAREARDWATADGLLEAIIADGERDEASGYLVYDRGRCTEALQFLEPVRKDYPVEYTSFETSVLLSALVCEAARLESSDAIASMALLAEAIDKEVTVRSYLTTLELYYEFARQPVLNEAAMRFLARHQLDQDDSGGAMESQIKSGRVDNVRRLLALGANPNELHGRQQSALGAVLTLLPERPERALEIARVLLDAGADPAMLVDFEAEKRPEGAIVQPTPAREKLDAMLKDANLHLSKSMPIRIDYYDSHGAEPGSKTPGYARFDVVNRSGRDVVLDSWRDADGFDSAGARVSLEFRYAPGKVWKRYGDADDEMPIPEKGRRVLFPDGDRILLYVPFSPYYLLDAPPGLQLRLRVPSMDGEDFLSLPFTLHDGRYVRGMWPRDPADRSVYVESGAKFEVPGGVPKAHEDHETAPHAYRSSH
jgi:hypothetical protein